RKTPASAPATEFGLDFAETFNTSMLATSSMVWSESTVKYIRQSFINSFYSSYKRAILSAMLYFATEKALQPLNQTKDDHHRYGCGGCPKPFRLPDPDRVARHLAELFPLPPRNGPVVGLKIA